MLEFDPCRRQGQTQTEAEQQLRRTHSSHSEPHPHPHPHHDTSITTCPSRTDPDYAAARANSHECNDVSTRSISSYSSLPLHHRAAFFSHCRTAHTAIIMYVYMRTPAFIDNHPSSHPFMQHSSIRVTGTLPQSPYGIISSASQSHIRIRIRIRIHAAIIQRHTTSE